MEQHGFNVGDLVRWNGHDGLYTVTDTRFDHIHLNDSGNRRHYANPADLSWVGHSPVAERQLAGASDAQG